MSASSPFSSRRARACLSRGPSPLHAQTDSNALRMGHRATLRSSAAPHSLRPPTRSEFAPCRELRCLLYSFGSRPCHEITLDPVRPAHATMRALAARGARRPYGPPPRPASWLRALPIDCATAAPARAGRPSRRLPLRFAALRLCSRAFPARSARRGRGAQPSRQSLRLVSRRLLAQRRNERSALCDRRKEGPQTAPRCTPAAHAASLPSECR